MKQGEQVGKLHACLMHLDPLKFFSVILLVRAPIAMKDCSVPLVPWRSCSQQRGRGHCLRRMSARRRENCRIAFRSYSLSAMLRIRGRIHGPVSGDAVCFSKCPMPSARTVLHDRVPPHKTRPPEGTTGVVSPPRDMSVASLLDTAAMSPIEVSDGFKALYEKLGTSAPSKARRRDVFPLGWRTGHSLFLWMHITVLNWPYHGGTFACDVPKPRSNKAQAGIVKRLSMREDSLVKHLEAAPGC